jgi:hypothetical protein
MIDLAGRRSNITGVNCEQMAVSSTVLLPTLKDEVANVIDKRIKMVLNLSVRHEGIKGAWRYNIRSQRVCK